MIADFILGIVIGAVARVSIRVWFGLWVIALVWTGLQGWVSVYRIYGTPVAALRFSWPYLLWRVALVNIGAMVGYGFADWALHGIKEIVSEIRRT